MAIDHSHPLTKYFFEKAYLQRIHHFLPDISGKEILEIGAGFGHFARAALRLHATVDAIEPRTECHSVLSSAGCRTVQNTHLESVTHDACYDFCVAITVLDEVDDKNQFLTQIQKFLKRSGTVLIEVRNTKYLSLTKRKNLSTDISKEEYVALFKKAGFDISCVGGAPRPLSFGGINVFIKTLLSNAVHWLIPHAEKQMLIFVLKKSSA